MPKRAFLRFYRYRYFDRYFDSFRDGFRNSTGIRTGTFWENIPGHDLLPWPERLFQPPLPGYHSSAMGPRPAEPLIYLLYTVLMCPRMHPYKATLLTVPVPPLLLSACAHTSPMYGGGATYRYSFCSTSILSLLATVSLVAGPQSQHLAWRLISCAAPVLVSTGSMYAWPAGVRRQPSPEKPI